jgi:transposase
MERAGDTPVAGAFFCTLTFFEDFSSKWEFLSRDAHPRDMNATELRNENERLKKLLAEVQHELTQTQAQHEAVAEQFTQTLEEKERQVAALEHQIKLLLQRIRGSRQERIDPDQLLLFSLEELQEIAEQLGQGQPDEDLIDVAASKRRRPSSGRVGKLPEHLQREIIRHELSAAERACPCCGDLRQEIGVESSEQLELIPAQLKVVQHDRVKYACRACEEHVAIADKPPQPIEKGLPGPGLCAHTVLSKFGDHQPMYRQEDIHSRLGYIIRRSTLCGWQAALADLAQPLVDRMKHLVLESKVIHTDDSATSEGWRVQWETNPPGQEPKPRSLDGRQEGNRMI